MFPVNQPFLGNKKHKSTHVSCKSTLLGQKLKDRITPHVTNFFRLRLTIEEQEGKRKYKSDGAVMVGEFVCMYVCSCTVSEWECEWVMWVWCVWVRDVRVSEVSEVKWSEVSEWVSEWVR